MIEMQATECAELLRGALVGRLSMVGPDGKPYTIPLRFVLHEEGIYLRFSFDGRKQDALMHTRNVCFEADEVHGDFSHYASVIIEGTLLDILEEAEKRGALVALNKKYEQLSGLPSPGPNPVTQGVAIRKIVIQRLTGRKNEPVMAKPRKVPPRWQEELLAYDRAQREREEKKLRI